MKSMWSEEWSHRGETRYREYRETGLREKGRRGVGEIVVEEVLQGTLTDVLVLLDGEKSGVPRSSGETPVKGERGAEGKVV